jgi:uncharacterized protein YjcR
VAEAKKKKRAINFSEIDWTSIKMDYITTPTSYRKLSEKYGVSATTICKQSQAGDWIAERERYNDKVYTKSVEKAANKEASRLAGLVTAANKAVDITLSAFEDDRQFNRYIVAETDGMGATTTQERVFEKIDTRALKDLTNVMKDLSGLLREFYNQPTPQQAEAQRISAERLELEKRKAEVDADTDTNIVVLLDGKIKDWSN